MFAKRAALTFAMTLFIVPACVVDETSEGDTESEIVEGEQELTCDVGADQCVTCSEYLADSSCEPADLCVDSRELRDELHACACSTCHHVCGDHCMDRFDDVTIECAQCATDACNPAVSACANDIPKTYPIEEAI